MSLSKPQPASSWSSERPAFKDELKRKVRRTTAGAVETYEEVPVAADTLTPGAEYKEDEEERSSSVESSSYIEDGASDESDEELTCTAEELDNYKKLLKNPKGRESMEQFAKCLEPISYVEGTQFMKDLGDVTICATLPPQMRTEDGVYGCVAYVPLEGTNHLTPVPVKVAVKHNQAELEFTRKADLEKVQKYHREPSMLNCFRKSRMVFDTSCKLRDLLPQPVFQLKYTREDIIKLSREDDRLTTEMFEKYN